jgi:hypothetical protein
VEEMDLLRGRARERITQGRLPRTKPIRTWGGSGVGLPCDLCDATIDTGQPEFELQFDLAPASRSIRFHRECHSVWNEVREEFVPGESEWRLVSEQLPPRGAQVEARVRFGDTRSIILSLVYSGDADSEERRWLNATTNDILPEGWHPVEWRYPAARGTDAGPSAEPGQRKETPWGSFADPRKEPVRRSAPDPREEPGRRSSPGPDAESSTGGGPPTSRKPSVPRRA